MQGWTWGSCSDNVSYGVSFAQRFLDEKEFDLVDMRNTTSVEQAVIHLHNNNVGRKVRGGQGRAGQGRAGEGRAGEGRGGEERGEGTARGNAKVLAFASCS